MLDRGPAFPTMPRRPCATARALAPEDVEPGPAARRGRRAGRLDGRGGAGGARGAAAVPAPVRAGAAGRGAGRPRRRHRRLPRCAPSSCSSPRAIAERARRRFEELRARGDAPIYAAVLAELQERDRRDADRAVAPMRVAPDAWVLDTTDLDARGRVRRGARPHREPGCRRRAAFRRLNHDVRACNPSPSREAGRRAPLRADAPSGAGMQEATQTIEPRPSLDDFAAMLDETLGSSARLEGSVVRGTVVGDRRRHRHRRRRPQVRRPRPAQGVRRARAAARGPGRRQGRGVRRALREQGWRGRPQPREGQARGELEPARARVHRHQQGRGPHLRPGQGRLRRRSRRCRGLPAGQPGRHPARCATSAR